MINADEARIHKARDLIQQAEHVTAFTGAGISVESGIPPFRGNNGIWTKYDPIVLDLDYFYSNTAASWKVIKDIFYAYFGDAKPNPAHIAIADLEKSGKVKAVITQNIDNLHQAAGSRKVFEFHGNSQRLVCMKCEEKWPVKVDLIAPDVPLCPKCNERLKPDFIFFGEQIPPEAYTGSMHQAQTADVFLVVGTTGEVIPAANIPYMAKQNGALIIEVNMEPSAFTSSITDIYLEGSASEILPLLTNTN